MSFECEHEEGEGVCVNCDPEAVRIELEIAAIKSESAYRYFLSKGRVDLPALENLLIVAMLHGEKIGIERSREIFKTTMDLCFKEKSEQ